MGVSFWPECTNGESKCEAGSKNSPMQLCVHGQYQIIECTGINDSSCTESTCSTSCDKDACVKIGSDSFLKFVCIEGKYNYQKYKICTDSACTVCG